MTTADQIPVAYTPPGGWRGEMPPPVLAGCAEPLAPDAPDLRGTWRAISVEVAGEPQPDHFLNKHVERIEQCGNRVVVTSTGIIHDMRADGTIKNGVNDVAAANGKHQIKVAAVFEDGKLELHPWGVQEGRAAFVTRQVIDGHLHWHYGPLKVTLERI